LESKDPAIQPLEHVLKGNNDGHQFGVSTIQWYSIDTGMFFTGSFDGTVKVWDTNSTTSIQQFDMQGVVYSIGLSPVATNHTLIATGTVDQKCRLCDVRTGTSTHTLIGHREAIYSVRWSPRSEYLLATGSLDKTIRFWDVRKAGCLMNLDQFDTTEVSSKNNKHKIRSNNQLSTATAHNGTVNSLCFTPDGRYLLSSGSDDRMRCWNISTGENTLVNFVGTKNSSKSCMQMCVSPDGTLVYHPNNTNINVYNIFTGELVHTLKGHYDKVSCCTFHPLHQELYSGGRDQSILAWTPTVSAVQEEVQVEEETDNWSDEEK